jgi:hypothetical protein
MTLTADKPTPENAWETHDDPRILGEAVQFRELGGGLGLNG